MPPRNNQQGNEPRFNGKSLVIDSLVAFLEGYAQDLGIKIPGVDRMFELLRGLKIADQFTIGTLDVAVKNIIRATAIFNPVVREGLEEVMDLFFDRLRLLEREDAREVKSAVDEGTKKARGKIEEIKKRKSAKPPFATIEAKLPSLVRDAWFMWSLSLDARERERLEAVKPLIENTERIVYVMGMSAILRLDYLEMTLKGKPGILETLKDAAMGRETPWTRDANRRVRAAEEKAKEFADAQDKAANEIVIANTVSPWETGVKMVILVAFGIFVITAILVAMFA